MSLKTLFEDFKNTITTSGSIPNISGNQQISVTTGSSSNPYIIKPGLTIGSPIYTTSTYIGIPSTDSIDLIKDFKNRKKELIERLEETEEIIKKLSSLEFKAGDIVIHKAYGNCVIKIPMIKGAEPAGFVFPNTITGDGYWVAHKTGECLVPTSELIPYTSVSKKLYEK